MSIEKMWQKISSARETDSVTETTDGYSIGDNSGELLLDSADLIQQHLTAMAGQSMRKLVIFSPVLSHRVYDSAELAGAISDAIRAYHKLQVRILICDPRPCVARHHRLVELAQQLSSFIEIRRAHEDYRTITHDYLIADERAYLRRPNFERFTAEANYNDPLKAQTETELFTGIWEQSEREAEFLSLHL